MEEIKNLKDIEPFYKNWCLILDRYDDKFAIVTLHNKRTIVEKHRRNDCMIISVKELEYLDRELLIKSLNQFRREFNDKTGLLNEEYIEAAFIGYSVILGVLDKKKMCKVDLS